MSEVSGNTVDLLTPAALFRNNYVHQIRQTIDAYSPSKVVLGEALQNAIDAVCDPATQGRGEIAVEIDFDSETVTVTDNGVGFPPDLSFLYLGGTTKQEGGSKGKIGVGIKVTMFSSRYFHIRSNNGERAWIAEISDANNFEEMSSLQVPQTLPDDPNPLPDRGTQVQYTFPSTPEDGNFLDHFVTEIVDTCLPQGASTSFGRSIMELNTGFPSPFAALLSSFLRRHSYVGDVLAAMDRQTRYPREGIGIEITMGCSNPTERFGEQVGGLYGSEPIQSFSVHADYLRVEDTLEWVPSGRRAPRMFSENLGLGGQGVTRTDGFNKLEFASAEQYETLLKNTRGNLPDSVDEYRRNLFHYVNGISLTMGRIPEFERFLPGGSQRVISCNGIVTNHEIDLTSGQNQQYVRCFDLIVDVDSDLNYGKTHLTNTRLVKRVRDFVNGVYARVLQNATATWVGRMPNPPDNGDKEIFVGRSDLGLADYVMRKVPRDENDVIALFFEMAGRGVFPNDVYRIYGLSQKDTYDCRAAIRRREDSEEVLTPSDDTRLRIVDFKLSAAEVMRDFMSGQKSAERLDMVIAWNQGERVSRDYAIYDIDQSAAYRASPTRVFPHVSRYIYDAREGYEVQLLILEEVVAQLKAEAGQESA